MKYSPIFKIGHSMRVVVLFDNQGVGRAGLKMPTFWFKSGKNGLFARFYFVYFCAGSCLLDKPSKGCF
jgi:hypothetical protein